MKKFYCIITLLLFISTHKFSQSYSLVWSDEFEAQTINSDVWNHETGATGWGNGEKQDYTTSPNNSFLQDGKLHIVANSYYNGTYFTSARMTTQGKKSFLYGRIEARIKLPYGQGIWPAFWAMGESFAFVGWPGCGEIDIMEMIGGSGRENTIHGTAHWDAGVHASHTGSRSLSSGTYSDDFHIYAVEWTETALRWYVDGNQYHDMDITPSALSEFHGEFFLILNLAVGGQWPGYPDETTVFPQVMEIDYVRVYQKTTGIEATDHTDLEVENFSAYPNPFNSMTRIVFNSETASEGAKMIIFNLLGEIVEQKDITINAGINSYSWSPETNLNSGFYYLQILGTSERKNLKLLYLK